MSIQDEKMNLEVLLNKFENGHDMYFHNSLFKRCIDSIQHGGDTYKVLGGVIKAYTELETKYENLLKSGVLRQEIIVTKEQYDDIITKYNID